MENPFADLIDKPSTDKNPFADLIDKKMEKLPGVNNPTIKYTDKYQEYRDQLNYKKQELPVIDDNTSWGKALGTALTQIPASSGRLLKDVVSAAFSPIDTAKGVGKIIAEPQGESFDKIVDHMKNRYGSVKGWKKAVALDPVGVLSDLSMVIMPVGGGIKQLGKLGKLGKAGKLNKIIKRQAGAPSEIATKGFAGVNDVEDIIKLTKPQAGSTIKQLKEAKKLEDKIRSSMKKDASKPNIITTIGNGITKVGEFMDPMKGPSSFIRDSKAPRRQIPGEKLSVLSKLKEKAGKVANIVDRRPNPRKGIRKQLKLEDGLDPLYTDSIRKKHLDQGSLAPKTIDNVVDKAVNDFLGPNYNDSIKVQNKIKSKMDEINNLIDSAPNQKINAEKFFKFGDELSIDNISSIDKTKAKKLIKEFKDGFKEDKGTIIGVDGKVKPSKYKNYTPQEMKVKIEGLNRQLNDGIKKSLTDPVPQNVRRALKNGIAKSLEEAIPELKGINKNLEEYVLLKNALTEATNGMTKSSLAEAISLAGVGLVGGVKTAGVGFLKYLFTLPRPRMAMNVLLAKLKKDRWYKKPSSKAIKLGLVLPERAKDKDNIQP